MPLITDLGMRCRRKIMQVRSRENDQVSGRESGLVLITALFMLVTLIGIVMICTYPLAHEKKKDTLDLLTLERWKDFERGAYGRFADQPGGKFNACGGYFSDTGMKVRKTGSSSGGEMGRMLDYWSFKTETYGTTYNKVTREYICKYNYRYDENLGFWAGYRGKRYIHRSPGEEHMRNVSYNYSGIEYDEPILIDGYKEKMFFKGYKDWAVHLTVPSQTAGEKGDPTRQYNPVDKLIVNINALQITGTLSTKLIYARQPTYQETYEVVSETGAAKPGEPDTFIFDWESDSGTCPGSAFQTGLKKLVIYEDGTPKLARAICIPPVRTFRSNKSEKQTSQNVYIVDVDYE